MKKGFTLIELLGVLAILGIISILSIPPILNALKRQDNLKYEQFTSAVKDSAEKYLEQNRDLYKNDLDSNNYVYISAGELIDKGYLIFDIKDPKTNNLIDKESLVEVSKNTDGTLIYKYPAVKYVDPNPLIVELVWDEVTVSEGAPINSSYGSVVNVNKPGSTIQTSQLPTGIIINNQGVISGALDYGVITWAGVENVRTLNISITVTNGSSTVIKNLPLKILRDTDGDFMPDIYDPDDDGDGTLDAEDPSPLNPAIR